MSTRNLNSKYKTTEEQIITRLHSRIKQLNLSLNNIQYELDSLNTILNAIDADLQEGES